MNRHILVLALAALALAAGRAAAQDAVKEAPAAAEDVQVGRYQIVAASDYRVYVLDTATGQCWMRMADGSWRDAGNPAKPKAAKDKRHGKRQAKRPAPKLDLPEKTVEMVVSQRETPAIPGSDGTIRVQLGDITAGQVFLTVTTKDGEPLLRRKSVAQGDTVEFPVGKKRYAIHIKELRNILVGDDFAKITIAEVVEEKAAGKKTKEKKAERKEGDR